MWTISLLKQNGLMNFKRNYWYCVVASLVLGVAVGGSSGGSSYNSINSANSNGSSLYDSIDPGLIVGILVAALVFFAVAMVIKILVLNPVIVGCRRFFIMNRVMERAELSNISFGFKSNWKNIVKTMFFQDLYIFLWSLLLLIPGIIKSYSYRLVPYILAENPDMDTHEAIELSKSMMNGQKMNAFIYDLSFIGWIILGILTCGIALIFYVSPYKDCSDAELYTAIKETYNPQATY